MSRETRLLLVTIVVSGAALLLLAQLRFPQAPAAVTTAAPLERLAARSSFEELATRVAQLEAAIAPSLIVLRLGPRTEPAPTRFGDVLSRLDTSPVDVRHVPALRLDATTAIAAVPPGARISGIVGAAAPTGTAGIFATDPLRGLARIRVPEGAARVVSLLPLENLQTPTYVVAVEGTHAGLTLRPVFLGRSDRFGSPRWRRPLLPLGGIVVTPGALMFTLDGEFLGFAVVEQGMLVIAGARDSLDVVEGLQAAPPAPVDPGIAVQPLTARLAAATGATRGAVVSEVVSDGPAAGVLEPGDVITDLGDEPVETREALLLNLATRLAAGPVTVTIVRDGERRTAELRPVQSAAPLGNGSLELATVRGTGTRIVSVEPTSPFATAGLRPGDLVVRAGAVVEPTAVQLRRIFDQRAPGDFLLLLVRREDGQHVIALQAPADTNAAGR